VSTSTGGKKEKKGDVTIKGTRSGEGTPLIFSTSSLGGGDGEDKRGGEGSRVTPVWSKMGLTSPLNKNIYT